MLASVLAGYLDSVGEREFDAPFTALLLSLGFTEVRYLHGSTEFGKDFIAKKAVGGVVHQYAFQTKATPVTLNDLRPQLDLLRMNTLAHPNFDRDLPRRAVVVTTRRLTGQARLDAQNHAEELKRSGQQDFEVWEQEHLLEHLLTAPEIALTGDHTPAFIEAVSRIDQRKGDDLDLERYSRQWIGATVKPWRPVLEAAILARHCRAQERLDLACFVALAAVRVTWTRAWPPDGRAEAAADLAKELFRDAANELWRQCDDALLDPRNMVAIHDPITAFATYPVRCLRLVEILSLLALSLPVDDGKRLKIASYVEQFVKRQPGMAHPLSDRFAVSLIPPMVLTRRHGSAATVHDWLIRLAKWVADRCEMGLGLAGTSATPEEALQRLVCASLEHVTLTRRRDSYLATVVLDLAACCELPDAYDSARNEFLAVGLSTPFLYCPDGLAQFQTEDAELRLEVNTPYADVWAPTDDWKTAPHHVAEPDRHLCGIGRSWDLLASSAAQRDRHFLSAIRTLLRPSGGLLHDARRS
jgi:hypothetical protein